MDVGILHYERANLNPVTMGWTELPLQIMLFRATTLLPLK